MLVGILSDTHDKIDPLANAIKKLQARGAEYFIHCGDVGEQGVLDRLAGLPLTFIWGNNDWDVAELADYAGALGLTCGGRFAELTLDGKTFAVTHGDNLALRQRILNEQRHDYLLQGHTHIYSDERVGRTRVINPGALYRAHFKTVALLDTSSDTLEKLIVG